MQKIITSISIVAILATGGLIFGLGGGSDLLVDAEEAYTVTSTADVITSTDKFDAVSFVTGGEIPTDGSGGAFGFGVITDAGLEAIAVTTTHAGVKDSVAQADASDPVFHNHYVALEDLEDDSLCPGLQVRDITFQEPGDAAVTDNKVSMTDVPYSFAGTHSLTGDEISFMSDHNVGMAVSFTINPVDGDGNTSVTDIAAVCINDVKPADEISVGEGMMMMDYEKSHLDVEQTTIATDSSEIERATFFAHDSIPTDGSGGAFGFGVITDAGLEAIAVTTTHAGVKDSVAQADASDPVFHNHYVALEDLEDDSLCPGLQVRDITFQEPGDAAVTDNKVSMTDVPYSFAGTHSLTGDEISFMSDHNVGMAVSFTINPVDGDGNTSVTDIAAVCINDVKPADNQYTLPKFWSQW